MSTPEITRNEFLRGSSCAAAGAILGGALCPARASGQAPDRQVQTPQGEGKDGQGGLMLRPYQLLCADWMTCAPCPNRAGGPNACVNVLGSGGLSNQKRDLDMLQKLGLEYGSTMKARDLFRRIFEKIK